MYQIVIGNFMTITEACQQTQGEHMPDVFHATTKVREVIIKFLLGQREYFKFIF